jgi:uncharacterized protein YkwD
MLRRHPGGSGAGRVALLALVPLVLGAGLWLTTAGGQAPATTRLEATQSSAGPLGGDARPAPWDAAAPATPAPGAPVGTGGAGETATTAATGPPAPSAGLSDPPAPPPAPASSAGRSAATDGGVGGGVGEGADSETSSETGTGLARSSADSSGVATSPASAATADESPSTTAASTTTSTPTTQATTTTTAPAPPPSTARARNPAAEAEVVPLTNGDRSAAGLGTVARNACLDSAASGFAEQMARTGVLAHNSGAGGAVAGCRPNATWGDNVGTSTPCDTDLLEEKWMDSPSHRRNIVNGAFTLIGVGAWTDEKGACWVQVLFSS